MARPKHFRCCRSPRVSWQHFLFCLLFACSALAQSVHTVQAGDTLSSIARSYGVSVSDLMRQNSLTGSTIYAGQTLELPLNDAKRAGVKEHSVQAGETLAAVAALYSLSEESVRRSNLFLEGTLADAPLVMGIALAIPPDEGTVVTLSATQTLLDVALEYGLSGAELARLNGLNSLGGEAGLKVFLPAVALANLEVPETVSRVSVEPRVVHEVEQLELLTHAAPLLATYDPAPVAFAWPVRGRISSRYGQRNISVGGNTFHGGVDVAASQGTPVAAAQAGKVVLAGWMGAYGYAVFINHGQETQTRYAHLSEISTQVGAYVYGGETIGRVGSTGASTGPHLHFELRFGGRSVDPLGYLP